MKNFVRKFPLPKGLSEKDKKVVHKLEKAVELVADIYADQANGRYSGANFYPHDVTTLEIEKAAKEDPAILSPYTVVERQDGKLKAVPYHIKFQDQLKKISQIIEEAASISETSAFKKYLKVTASALLNGDYDKIHSTWMETRSNINFLIGPIEYYDDRLFSKKRSYQASVGILNKDKIERATEIKNVLYINAKDNIALSHHSLLDTEKVQVLVTDGVALGGFLARVLFSGEYFPNDFDLLRKTGVKIVFYNSSLKLKFEKLHFPIFKSIFSKEFQKSYSKELLLEATFLYIVLYELARQLHHFDNADDRLLDLYPTIDEGNASVSAIQHCKHLLTKGVIDQKMLEALMIIHICWMFSDWVAVKNNPAMTGYVQGSTIALNFYFKSGALHETGGISWPNFPKMFFEIERLSDILARVLTSDNRDQANEFIHKFGSMDYFNRFSPRLKGINLL